MSIMKEYPGREAILKKEIDQLEKNADDETYIAVSKFFGIIAILLAVGMIILRDLKVSLEIIVLGISVW